MEDDKKMSLDEMPENINDSLSPDDEPLDPDTEIKEMNFIPLDSLLYENDETTFDTGSSYHSDNFESFFTEYRALIAENFSAAKKMRADNNQVSVEDVSYEQDTKITKSTIDEDIASKQIKKKDKLRTASHKSSIDREESITLKPEEYEQTEAQEIFCEAPQVEEETVDLLLGMSIGEDETEKKDNAQISFFPENTAKAPNNEELDEKIASYDPENPRKIDYVFDFLELFIYTLVVVMILTTFFFKHSVVDGDSMNNTLEDGDHLIVWDAFYTPERYDIVVFEDYSITDENLKKPIVKRVIGLPGETVEIKKDQNGEFLVYIDGQLIEEEYAYHGIHYSSPNTGAWTLGENEIFVMGDNRYNSIDSRDSRVGPISIDSVLGKVVLRFFPFNKFGTLN